MGVLKKLLDLYRESLKPVEDEEVEVEEEVNTEDLKEILEHLNEGKLLETPEEGKVFELVPSLDTEEMLFLILNVNEDFTTVIPLSRWIEFATPDDVLINLNGKPYIAQTDIALDIPTQGFNTWFGNRKLYEVGKISEEELKKVKEVYEGSKSEARLTFPEKREFKKIEAGRYLPIWVGMINFAEETAELYQELKELVAEYRKVAPARASEQIRLHGSAKNISFFYDEEKEELFLYPEEEFVGKEGRIIIKYKDKELIFYKGTIKPEYRIPLSREAFDYEFFKEGLRLELL
ncbi:MAG: hypothetical protein DSY32_00095 [Aquifex sp.]|nr:MAG: hypothetical protein DSY32_00095 [Aquifex sp.]